MEADDFAEDVPGDVSVDSDGCGPTDGEEITTTMGGGDFGVDSEEEDFTGGLIHDTSDTQDTPDHMKSSCNQTGTLFKSHIH